MNLLFGQDDDGIGDIDTASAGNGGGALASANGGAVGVGDVNSGSNAGNVIGVGDTGGELICDKYGKCYPGEGGFVAVDGGDVANSTNLGIAANGGTAIADASGGDDNFADATDFDGGDNGGGFFS